MPLACSAGMAIFAIGTGWRAPIKGVVTSALVGMCFAMALNVPIYLIGRWLGDPTSQPIAFTAHELTVGLLIIGSAALDAWRRKQTQEVANQPNRDLSSDQLAPQYAETEIPQNIGGSVELTKARRVARGVATAWWMFRLPPFSPRRGEAVERINPKRPSHQQTKLKALLNELESKPSPKPLSSSFDAPKSGLGHRPLSEKAKPHPLTTSCMQLSAFESLLKAVNSAMIDASSGTDKRAIVLFLIIMSAAGNFVEGIKRDEPYYKEMRQYLRDTNPDVITGEAIVWITFLIGQMWKADQKKDREIFERVGYVTISKAGQLALEMIKSKTSFDFTARAIESRKLYLQSVKGGKLVEAFASVLFRSVGCRSLAEPLKIVAWPSLDLVWMHINIAVSIFFSSMPLGYYDTFKNMLRERSDLFPHDDDDFDD